MAFGFCRVQSANLDADYDQITIKNHSNYDQKSFKNLTKIRQTSIKNTNLFY